VVSAQLNRTVRRTLCSIYDCILCYHFTVDLVLLCTQLKTASTVCRASKGQCDLPEFCGGIDPLCPSDVYKRNTEKCSVDEV